MNPFSCCRLHTMQISLSFQNKISSWCGSINMLLKYFPELMNFQRSTSSSFKAQCKNFYRFISWTIGTERVILCLPLDTYYKIKQHFALEKNLTIMNNFVYRKTLTKFRISAHQLRVESGRYVGLSRTLRICMNCALNVVEDEIHFLLNCPKITTIRELLFLNMQSTCQL